MKEGGAHADAGASAAAIAAAGLVSLAVAMGIGRFAFTPILPMMLSDGVVDIASASWLASANYVGYLVGAVFCTLQPWLARFPFLPAAFDSPRAVRTGLAATALLTLAMALPWPAAWPTLRFAAGVASAVTLIHTTGWCFAQLAARDRAAWGGLVFAGPGAGIVVSGVIAGAVTALHGAAAVGWAVFALLGVVLTASVWRVFAQRPASLATAASGAAPAPPDGAVPAGGRADIALLAAAYGLAGFGYIVTATFLPVIARTALPGSRWIDLFWPVFGIGAFIGSVLATRVGELADRRLVLASTYVVQAAGVLLGLLWPTLPGFVAGSFLAGLPFTTITFFALQEARRLRPRQAASAIGLLTATYGVGQIAGPPMVSLLVAAGASAAAGFDDALIVAAAMLLLGSAIHVTMWRRWPAPGRTD